MKANSSQSRPLYRIQAVAKATQISEHALRVWERRYGTLSSHRSPAGYRLYTDEDIAKIRTIKDLLDQGHAIGEIAALSMKELERLRDRSRGAAAPSALPEPIAEVACRRFLDAIEALDPEEASRVAAASIVAFPPFELVNNVFGPLLQEIGDRWQSGRFTIAQEHAASAVIRGHLGELIRMHRPGETAPAVIATTPEGELHEFGAMLASVAASSMGARLIYLGPNTPAADIGAAAKGARARAVIVSIVCADASRVVEVLTRIRKAVPRSTAIWAGGRAVTKQPPTGITWARSLEDVRTLSAGL